MPFTPVPSVAAGDWIDEIFLNTYLRDNFAAGVPDVFSAKGQLAVGTGVDTMGVLNPGADGLALFTDSSQSTGLIWKLIKLISNRQGGSASDWDASGTTNYTPSNEKIQAGVVNLPNSNTATGSWFYGSVTVTFPTAFSAKPLVICSALFAGLNVVKVSASSPTTTQVTIFIITTASVTGVTMPVAWAAIGQ